MRAHAVLILATAAALAGCAERAPGSFTIDLDAVAPEKLLAQLALPEDFEVERSMPQERILEGVTDGHALGLGRETNESREQITIGLLLLDSRENAARALDALTRAPPGAVPFSPLTLGDEAWIESSTRQDERFRGGATAVIARVDAYVFWVAYDAVGVEPSVDAEALARELADLITASD